jgi:hypothetical protein
MELERVQAEIGTETRLNREFINTVEAVFNLTQRAADTWLGSNSAVRRELLEVFSLNRELNATSLEVTWSKPFDELVKQPNLRDGTGDWI